MPGINPQGFGPTPGQRKADHVEVLRKLLINRGYIIPPHGGHMGTRMRSALADLHSGDPHPHQWDQAHPRSDSHLNHPGGIDMPDSTRIKQRLAHNLAHDPTRNGPHGADIPKTPAQKQAAGVAGTHPGPTHHVAPNDPVGHPHNGGGNRNGGGGGGGASFTTMLTHLLGQSDTGQMLPKALADKIAGVDDAAASGFQSQLDHLPAAKKAALHSIANWFGQVSGAEGTAAERDNALAQAGSSAMQDAAKGIAASLGGSANPGAGEIGAVGANDANTLAAMGASDKMLSSDLAPIFALSAADAKNARSQQYDQAKSDLENSLAQAQGQGTTDRANALMQILQANNASRQTNFGNKSGLLNTLASLQISGMNAASEAQSRAIMNAYHMAQIKKSSQKQAGGLSAMTPTELSDFVDKITQGLVDPNTGKLKSGIDWPSALRMARNSARSAGLDPRSKQVIQTVIGPALSNAGITAQGGGFWPAIYQP